MTTPKPTDLAAAIGISIPYASQLLSGSRTNVSAEIALAAFRAFGVRLGLLAEMTDVDIAKLVAQQLMPADCHGADACASDPDDLGHAVSGDAPVSGADVGESDQAASLAA